MELMELLYRIMEELSNAGVPIVFKGAMVLNLVMRENNPSRVERATRDIDGDWVGIGPTMEQMENALRRAVKAVDPALDVTANLQSWIQILQKDPNELFRAAADAGKIADYIVANYAVRYPLEDYIQRIEVHTQNKVQEHLQISKPVKSKGRHM